MISSRPWMGLTWPVVNFWRKFFPDYVNRVIAQRKSRDTQG
jgi:hypothetical protein